MPEYLAPGVYVEEIDTGSKPIEGVSSKDFTSGCKDHLFHVLPTDPETTSSDTGNNLVFWVIFGSSGKAQFTKM